MSNLNTALNGSATFGPLKTALALPLPATNWAYLNDVLLSLHGTLPEHASHAVSRLNISFASIDLTAPFISAVRGQLDDPQSTLAYRAQFISAIKHQLHLEETISKHFNVPIDRDRALLTLVEKPGPLSRFLDSLGDKTFGWAGRLHLFNFLFAEVKLQPISINSLLRTLGIGNVASLEPATIAFYVPAGGAEFSPAAQAIEGTFEYTIELIYDNPLDVPIHNINQALQPGERLDLQLGNLKNSADTLLARIEKCNEALGDAHLAEALRDTLNELKIRLKL